MHRTVAEGAGVVSRGATAVLGSYSGRLQAASGQPSVAGVWQIVVETAWFLATLYIALVLLRMTDLFLKSRWPSGARALEFGIGQA